MCAVADDDNGGGGGAVAVPTDKIRFEAIFTSKHRAFPLMKYKHCVCVCNQCVACATNIG